MRIYGQNEYAGCHTEKDGYSLPCLDQSECVLQEEVGLAEGREALDGAKDSCSELVVATWG